MRFTMVLCSAISLCAIGLLIADMHQTLAECNSTDDCGLSVNNAANADIEGFFDDGSVNLTWNLTDDPGFAGCSADYDNTVNIVENSVDFTPNIIFPSSCTGNQDFDVEGNLFDETQDGTVTIFGFTSGPSCTTSNTAMHVNSF